MNNFNDCCFQKPLDDDFIWIGPNQPLTKYKAHPNGSYYTNWQETNIAMKKEGKVLASATETDRDIFVSLDYKYTYKWYDGSLISMCNDKLDIVQDCNKTKGQSTTYFYLCEFDFDWIE